MSQAEQETDSDSEKEESSTTITIRKLKSNKKMLISKNQRLCGVLDKIDTVIVEGTKMTHTQVTQKSHLRSRLHRAINGLDLSQDSSFKGDFMIPD